MRFQVRGLAVPGGLMLAVADRPTHRTALEPRRFRVDLAPDTVGTPRPILGNDTDFPYVVSQDDPEWFMVELDWSSAGQSGTLRIDRNGEPFRTATPHGRQFYSWDSGDAQNGWAARS